MIFEAKASSISFTACALWISLPLFNSMQNLYLSYTFYSLLVLTHLYALVFVARNHFSIFIRAYGLGALFVLGVCVTIYTPPIWFALGVYISVVAFFHVSEYLSTALFNPSTLDTRSFLINHSRAYNIAHLTCCVEYLIWCWLCPGIKLWTSIQMVGLALCIFGEVFRKGAMYAAGVNFTHLIQYRKRREHTLVTSGIYSICRHPSYAGWFCWSVATQILVCNPVCFIGFCIASWKFFDERIYEEEQLLLNFFQTDYLKYQDKVPTGVPFVKGYKFKSYAN